MYIEVLDPSVWQSIFLWEIFSWDNPKGGLFLSYFWVCISVLLIHQGTSAYKSFLEVSTLRHLFNPLWPKVFDPKCFACLTLAIFFKGTCFSKCCCMMFCHEMVREVTFNFLFCCLEQHLITQSSQSTSYIFDDF